MRFAHDGSNRVLEDVAPLGAIGHQGKVKGDVRALRAAADQLEDEGGIEDINTRLSTDEELREVTYY